jgi:glycosyltransferase involved in cell wall biosynthesis
MGGAEKFLIQLANYFNSIGIKNDVLLLSKDSELCTELNEEIKIFKFIRNSRYDFTIFKKIGDHVKENSYEKIFCINTYAFFFVRLALINNNKIPIILSPHTTKPFSIYKFLQNFIYYRFIRANDKIIYLCKKQQQYLKNKYLYKNLNNDIIYNGINIEYFNPALYHKKDIEMRRKELGISNTEKIIVQVARISREKRQIDSIKSLSLLHKKHKIKAHLILVGSGEESLINLLIEQINRLELNKYVHLVGNQHDVRQFYYISDMFTLTSNSETFPISALEALSFGIPCVLTNVGGIKEIILDEKYGQIANIEDPNSIASEWNKVLKSNYDKKTIRAHITKNFSENIMLKRYKSIIEEKKFSKFNN